MSAHCDFTEQAQSDDKKPDLIVLAGGAAIDGCVSVDAFACYKATSARVTPSVPAFASRTALSRPKPRNTSQSTRNAVDQVGWFVRMSFVEPSE